MPPEIIDINGIVRSILSPLWVISAVSTVGLPLPISPYKRTSSNRPGMSETCQHSLPHTEEGVARNRSIELLPEFRREAIGAFC